MINNDENDCFTLIWYYWYKKYMEKKSKRKTLSNELANLKKQYSIQAIQSQNNPHLLSQKLLYVTQKTKSSKSSSTVYTINPQTEAKEIEELFIKQGQKQKTKQLINQLYSYYLNSKNVFVIYRGNVQNPTLEQFSKIITEDDSLQRNQSLMESYQTDNKIDGLEVGDMLSQFDGIQLWNAKFKNIPHTFIKVKKYSWTKAFNKPINHPSQPKTINNLPILPRIVKYKPSIDKLKPFITYIKMLQEYFPDNYPTIDSIYQYNNMPYIFVQEGGWQTNIGVLCYFIVFGDPEANLNKNIVDRWVQNNSNTLLANTIAQMTERQNNKNKYGKQGISKGLGLLTGQDSNGIQIW